jgi:Ni2+-binding GTPase involved in maturation of urease and hydrogenase
VNPTAKIFPVSCRTGAGLEEWISWFRNRVEKFKENVKGEKSLH